MTSTEMITVKEWNLDAPIDKQLMFDIIERVAYGWTLKELENDPKFPPVSVFLAWMVKNPEFNQLWHKAREISSYSLEDEALYLLREARKGGGALQSQNYLRALQMLVEQLRWSADKRNTGVFGSKNQASIVVPIQINTTLDLGNTTAGTGTAEFPNIYEITHPGSKPKPDVDARRRVVKATDAERMKALETEWAREREQRTVAQRKASAERMRKFRAKRKEKDVGSDTPNDV